MLYNTSNFTVSKQIPPSQCSNQCKMAPRKPRGCNHSTFINTCAGCKYIKTKKARKEASDRFRAEVEVEVNFQKSIPVLDDSARQKAEKAREVSKTIMRAKARAYMGPPLQTRKAIKAEETRQIQLTKEFNKVAARWSRVKQEANIKFLKWSNNELENQMRNAEFDDMETDIKRGNVRESITNVMAKIKEYKVLKKNMATSVALLEQKTKNGN